MARPARLQARRYSIAIHPRPRHTPSPFIAQTVPRSDDARGFARTRVVLGHDGSVAEPMPSSRSVRLFFFCRHSWETWIEGGRRRQVSSSARAVLLSCLLYFGFDFSPRSPCWLLPRCVSIALDCRPSC